MTKPWINVNSENKLMSFYVFLTKHKFHVTQTYSYSFLNILQYTFFREDGIPQNRFCIMPINQVGCTKMTSIWSPVFCFHLTLLSSVLASTTVSLLTQNKDCSFSLNKKLWHNFWVYCVNWNLLSEVLLFSEFNMPISLSQWVWILN